MSHYKPYPAYKDSGVKWLGRVPEHWYVVRMRYAATLNPPVRRDLLDDPDQEVSFLPMEAIGEDGSLNLEQNRPVADVRSGYSYFEDGDVAFAKVTPCFENGKGTLMRGLQCAAGFGTTELTVLRPYPAVADARYINYIVQGSSFRAFGAGAMTGAGGLKRVPDEFTRNFPVSLPEVGEQRVIASKLDRETVRIDALIKKKTRFIELLREKRQALITHAVTKGLNPGVRLKDSGVEWLGEVPEHWSFGRLAYACELIVDGTHHSPESYPEGAFKYITAKNIKEHGFDFTELTYLSADQHQEIYSRCSVMAGDVLYIKDGATAGVAMVNYLEEEFSLLSSVAVIRPKKKRLLSEYLTYVLNSGGFKTSVLSRLVGGAITRFTLEMIGNFSVSLPSIEEQRQVVAHLEGIVPRLDVLKGKTERSIELLKERRSALITAAVTGQIDLREAV